MKKILTILFIIPFAVNAQIDPFNYPDTLTGKKDTVEVKLLVAVEDDPLQLAYIIKGYSVRNEHCCTTGPQPTSDDGLVLAIQLIPNVKYFVHDHYLGSHKKPLPTNIKVWMTQ